MALNSPLFKSLIDKINFKALQTINDNISYIDTDKVNHRNNDPIQEMFKILWKCYTIYYQLFDKVETCNIISKYNDVINKIFDKEENISLRSTITNNVKKEKIEDLNKLIKRFKYLKNIVVNKKEKVQINNVYVFELNNFHNKQYILEGKNDVANGFYNFHKNIGIFNNFNRSIPAITSNTVTLYICRSYIRQLQLYGNKPIKNSKLTVLFYDETTKLLDIFNSLISKQYTIKYNSQVYLIMNVINNTFIKLSKPYLNDNDVINIIEYLKLFNRKFVNSMY